MSSLNKKKVLVKNKKVLEGLYKEARVHFRYEMSSHGDPSQKEKTATWRGLEK